MITYLKIGTNGRLSNQMFQYATLVSVAKANSFDYVLPNSCIKKTYDAYFNPVTNRSELGCFELFDCFKINCELIEDNELRKEIRYQYNEPSFLFDGAIFRINDHTNIHGYFQSWKYIVEHEYEIRKQFGFKDEILEKAKKYINSIKCGSLVSLHVRRGDYLTKQHFHPVCSNIYYATAIEKLKDKLKDITILVQSDDIEWCKNNFIGEEFIFSEKCSGFEDMARMTLCDHHIIANSSFSWWGAWLNSNPNKIIYAPSQWFGDNPACPDSKDLVPREWILL
jgi:hypothetical protein